MASVVSAPTSQYEYVATVWGDDDVIYWMPSVILPEPHMEETARDELRELISKSPYLKTCDDEKENIDKFLKDIAVISLQLEDS